MNKKYTEFRQIGFGIIRTRGKEIRENEKLEKWELEEMKLEKVGTPC